MFVLIRITIKVWECNELEVIFEWFDYDFVYTICQET